MLVRICEFGYIPSFLKRIIEDKTKHKVAQGASQEIAELREHWEVAPQSFIDLHHIALRIGASPRSLRGLVGLFLKKRLDKHQQLTIGNKLH